MAFAAAARSSRPLLAAAVGAGRALPLGAVRACHAPPPPASSSAALGARSGAGLRFPWHLLRSDANQGWGRFFGQPAGKGGAGKKGAPGPSSKGAKDAPKGEAGKGEAGKSAKGESAEGANEGGKGKGKGDPDAKGGEGPRLKASDFERLRKQLEQQPGQPQRLALLGGFIALYLLSSAAPVDDSKEITYQDFRVQFLETGRVERVEVINGTTARIFLHADRFGSSAGSPDGTGTGMGGSAGGSAARGARRHTHYFRIGSVDAFERKLEDAQEDMGLDPRDFVPVQYRNEVNLVSKAAELIPALLPVIILLAMLRNMQGGGRGRNIFSMGKTRDALAKGDRPTVKFSDVAGMEEAKQEIEEFVKFLRESKRFEALGAKIPKGAILVGPPGTGKTLLAKAVAGEADVPFFSMAGSEFLEMFVGVGASRVRDLFEKAREAGPAIVFIDEIDAIGRKRGGSGGFSGGGNDERESTLNQLLVELDGMASKTGVVVLASTNRQDVLDPALLRPGRFDRKINVDRPDLKGRMEIFLVHLAPLKLADEEAKTRVAKRMASLTPGFVGADIMAICNEAALIAARNGKDAVEDHDFEAAVDRVIGGLEKKNLVISPEERKTVAYHEAGHAVVGWFLEHADPLLKVSIVPRGSAALGYAQYNPRDRYLMKENEMLDAMCMTLGGRVAEEVFFSAISTGAQNDLEKVTQMAYSQVSLYGFNEKIGPLSFPPKGEMQIDKPYSQKTAETIDEEARKIVFAALDRTRHLVREKRDLLEKVALELLDVEVLTRDQFEKLVGPRPFKEISQFDDVVEAARKKKVASGGVQPPTDGDAQNKKKPGDDPIAEPEPIPVV